MDTFIDAKHIEALLSRESPSLEEVGEILDKAKELKGLSEEEAATLLKIEDAPSLERLFSTAGEVKREIYGQRLVLFAPLYLGSYCDNNCTYCGFRSDNQTQPRVTLTRDQIISETEILLTEGHKRLLVLSGESKGEHPLSALLEAIETIYSVRAGRASIRRINVEIAPLHLEEFRTLATASIGTYACFQETYDRRLYRKYHVSGPKSDYHHRLYVMDRAMEGGLDDVGIGALFGLGDWRFETLALMQHARHLEKTYGCGPHTISVPRIEPAPGAPDAIVVPHPVDDVAFKKLVATLRITLPYTGLILSTREKSDLREELFRYGISQISAGSRTVPGGYSSEEQQGRQQFSLGDHRTLDQVVSSLIDEGYIPSFCTGCYRKERTGRDFMDLAKPGLIKKFCEPNGLFSFVEYLEDHASNATKEKGMRFIETYLARSNDAHLKKVASGALCRIQEGDRDLYL